MTELAINQGSFRDPAGYVVEQKGKIFRIVSERARSDYEAVRDGGAIAKAIENGSLIGSREIDKGDFEDFPRDGAYLIEHERIPYVSYPYEWSFNQLKSAALHHLNFQIDLLKADVELSDATAYNIQFVGSKPIFIDLLSLRPYNKGGFWLGHRQFCEQFLNPLLLRALVGIAHNAMYRGALEGLSSSDLASLIPLRKCFSWNVLSQVIMQAKLEGYARQSPEKAIAKAKSKKQFSKSAYQGFLVQLKKWISKLEPAHIGKSVWGGYANKNTYTEIEADEKRDFITKFASSVKPKMLVDLGCNTGNYTVAALDGGAGYVIGFDFDQNAIDLAYARAQEHNLPFLPLWLDAANPSPDQGWRQAERAGFAQRTKANAVMALAFVHHLAIAKNIPLPQVLDWILEIAPTGIIEFVPKDDPTVQIMLSLRDDIFDHYSEETFSTLLQQRARIVQTKVISESGRKLFWYAKD